MEGLEDLGGFLDVQLLESGGGHMKTKTAELCNVLKVIFRLTR